MRTTKSKIFIHSNTVISPCCKSVNTYAILKKARDPLGLDNFDIFQCNICQSCFTYPIPINLDHYYPEYYRGYGTITTYLLVFFYRMHVKKWIKNSAIKNGSYLEIGCGSGIMLKVFSDFGWSVSGIERTSEIAKKAKEKCNNLTIYQSIDIIPSENFYDLIILFNVLEHLEDPNYYISKCNKLLSKSGRLIITVPNFSSYQRHIFNKNWFHLDPPRHLFHFTEKSLSILLDKHNMVIENISFVSYEHDPIGWIESFLNLFSSNKNLLTGSLLSENKSKILTRFIIISISIILVPVSIIFSVFSWFMKRGAIMQVVVKKAN